MTARFLPIVLFGLVACNAKSSSVSTDARHEAQPSAASTSAPQGPQAAVSPDVAAPEKAPPTAEVQTARLVVVPERSKVCMVNDQYMGNEQIPVTIVEKTYYGCCPMCKGRLERDPDARAAKDPVSGNSVDKATAVIGRAPSGKVFYFESEDTLRQYKL